jgi:hypothetical protein
VKPVNQQDTVILPETLTALVDFTHQIGIDLKGSALTLDAGFDSQVNKEIIKAHGMKPVIYPNRRNTKTPIVMARMFRWFDRALYRLRYNPSMWPLLSSPFVENFFVFSCPYALSPDDAKALYRAY